MQSRRLETPRADARCCIVERVRGLRQQLAKAVHSYDEKMVVRHDLTTAGGQYHVYRMENAPSVVDIDNPPVVVRARRLRLSGMLSADDVLRILSEAVEAWCERLVQSNPRLFWRDGEAVEPSSDDACDVLLDVLDLLLDANVYEFERDPKEVADGS